MKHYKKPNDPAIYGYELDGSQDHLITADMVPCEQPSPPVPPPPTKDQRIAALLAAKGVTRLLVQLTIEVSEDKAKALAPSYGLTPEQGVAYAYSTNKAYRECKDLETAIRAIEVAP